MELIEKKDPQMDKLADLVGSRLGGLLGKPEQEMTLMIKRSSLLNKKNAKKAEVENTVKLINKQIECTLKKMNRRSQNDYLDLKDLKPNFNFKMPDDLKTLVQHFRKLVEDYIAVNNEYVKTKINEEKAKAKKPRLADDKFEQQLKERYETFNYKTEMTRIVKELVKGLPEAVQPVMENRHLNVIFGVQVRHKPVVGNIWNKIVAFPTVTPLPIRKASQPTVPSQPGPQNQANAQQQQTPAAKSGAE